MINGPTSGTVNVVLDTILQLFNAGSSSIGNLNAPGQTTTVTGASGAGGASGTGG